MMDQYVTARLWEGYIIVKIRYKCGYMYLHVLYTWVDNPRVAVDFCVEAGRVGQDRVEYGVHGQLVVVERRCQTREATSNSDTHFTSANFTLEHSN